MMPKTNRLGVRKYSVAAGATRRVSRERWIARKAHRRGHGVGGYPEKRPQPTFCGSFLGCDSFRESLVPSAKTRLRRIQCP